MEEKKQRGGCRPGSGRKATDRNVPLMVRITQEAADKLAAVKNKSEFIDDIIKKNL